MGSCEVISAKEVLVCMLSLKIGVLLIFLFDLTHVATDNIDIGGDLEWLHEGNIVFHENLETLVYK